MNGQAVVNLPGNDTDHTPRRRLLGVIPIAQAVAADRLHIILSAIERFDRYAILTVHLSLSAGHPHLRQETGRSIWPMSGMSAVDDLGTKFTVGSHGGMGGGAAYRLECEITPAIPDRARRLSITIERIAWEDLDDGPPGDVTIGPWIFEVDLAKQLDARLIPTRE